MFMETWTRPRSARSKPFARTAGSPPSLSRISFAIRFARPTSRVRRFTFQAIRTGLAPTIVGRAAGGAPPVGPPGRRLVQVHGDAELLRDPPPDGPGEGHAVVHRDPRDRDEGEVVERGHPPGAVPAAP